MRWPFLLLRSSARRFIGTFVAAIILYWWIYNEFEGFFSNGMKRLEGVKEKSAPDKLENSTVSLLEFNNHKTFARKSERWTAAFQGEVIKYDVLSVPDVNQCSGTEVMIGVISSVWDFDMRQAIRGTYANPNCSWSVATAKVRVSFIVGSSHSVSMQSVLKENQMYRDVLTLSLSETYKNLPLKVHALLYFKKIYCAEARLLMKTDDDVVIDADRLLHITRRLRKENAIYGNLYDDSVPSRNPRSKWFVSSDRYQLPMFPEYVGGVGYVMTADAVNSLLENTFRVKLIFIEDVLMTGIVAAAANVTRQDERRSFAIVERKEIPNYWPCDPTGTPYLVAEHDSAKLNSTTFALKYEKLRNITCAHLPVSVFLASCKYVGICW